MLLSIRHKTSYTYNHPVRLESHCLRLNPRIDSYDALLERTLNIFPQPSHTNTNVENDGSLSQQVCFKGETDIFVIESRLLISLIPEKNPFDFLVYPNSCLSLPMIYPSELFRELRMYLTSDGMGPKIRDFAHEIMTEAKGRTVDFLVLLARRIKEDFVYELRPTGAAYQAEDTLATKQGSCRDLAVLYMAAARAMGLAARFVSGYYFDEKPQFPELHAWVEVYIPGGGWRGFDPTLGLACYEHHLALASSANVDRAAVIQGHFKGPEGTTSQMKLELEYQYSSMPVGLKS